MFKYSVITRWSDEDEGFIATVPELPGLSVFGRTQKKAVSELEVAAGVYLESLRESGVELPIPDKLVPHSGQIRLRMPKGLHKELAERAELEGVSLNSYIVSLLSERKEIRKSNEDLEKLIGVLERSSLAKLQQQASGKVSVFAYHREEIPSIKTDDSYFPIRGGNG